MHIMSAFEYSFLAGELSRSLVGKHLSRIRKIGEKRYRMKIGSDEVICELGMRINITRYIEPCEGGDKFAEKIEKELGNARLKAVRQVCHDRILSFDFEKGSLIFEMFGEGNAILIRDGAIIAAHRYETWSDREIKAGSPYKAPKTSPSEALELSDKYVIVSLMKMPLGKEYALEAISRSGIDEKTPGTSLNPEQRQNLEKAIDEMLTSARPTGFFEGGRMADFSLARLSKLSKSEPRDFATLSEAADEYYANAEKPNLKLEKLLGRLEKQKERIAALKEEEKELKAKGDLIYERYSRVEELSALAKSGDFGSLEKQNVKIDKKGKTLEADL
ncbi:MAG: NFACT family protein [Candidatus Micrarchaeota archaeon]